MGSLAVMGGHFLVGPLFEGPKGGYPPKKIPSFLLKSLFKIIRKSQNISATFAWPFGRDKCSKKVRQKVLRPIFDVCENSQLLQEVKYLLNATFDIYEILDSSL